MTDRDSAAWWERVAEGRLEVQECSRCGTLRFPARAFCPRCRAEDWRWRAVEPVAEVDSWIVERRTTPPTTIVRVRLARAPHVVMYGNWRAEREPSPGERVGAVFEDGPKVNWVPRP
ncbi:Zn-ribbon domain-containing OB-fold protein [Nonomuraea soli]|uniref:ChsH2 rubredoxin-like zinc ribbon domain-containing protein n=1 Tax=Nonomuraea soli TaxID=1032476 RepID=A0A7W0CCV8_9ACTN|nr:zinc ribbon domain-containing protein [Nonomuraea soli]MBA2888816.1 hypothetical protein [Nonomuraea soli]